MSKSKGQNITALGPIEHVLALQAQAMRDPEIIERMGVDIAVANTIWMYCESGELGAVHVGVPHCVTLAAIDAGFCGQVIRLNNAISDHRKILEWSV